MSETATTIRVLGIPGSLRKASFNRALLVAAGEMLPAGMTLTVTDLNPLPVFSQDLEASPPEAVTAFRGAIAAADALLIATPEYNYSVPGGLKNAIDWASRPPRGSVLAGKLAAILGASAGRFGTVRAQEHLRQVARGTRLEVMTAPELMVASAQDKFDPELRLADAETREHLRKFLAAFAEWVARARR